MDFIAGLRQKAAALQRTIVLPETWDERTLRATATVLQEGVARVILLGNRNELAAKLPPEVKSSPSLQIVDPATDDAGADYATAYWELRRH